MPSVKEFSKMQKVRRRELRRAIQKLHDKLHESPEGTLSRYGLQLAITIIGQMRKEIERENREITIISRKTA